MNDGGLSDVVSMTPLSDIARIDILDDRDGRPRFIQLVDINGADVTSILNLPVNSDGEVEVQQVIDNSVFTNLENDSINRYKADGMGGSIMNALEEFKELIGEKERRQQRVDLLKWMRTLIFKLNDVFGFDDYKQLEALIAAWLMKNSTCRLSGIPGTGKTTVIECASTLLANSYGYHTSKTYSAGEQYLTNLGSSADPVISLVITPVVITFINHSFLRRVCIMILTTTKSPMLILLVFGKVGGLLLGHTLQ